ncbi:hypothetical protein BROUX41_004277 [Berkeleyomyces rouxiae]|uniref:uncharacterized protein n=1 Tax=Berkeleyomyces rouxiae TaxID=2035830 RepID=UPI003B8097C5
MAIFAAPGLELMQDLLETHPCRSLQIETLATLLHPDAAMARNIVVYGPEATGKSSITQGVAARISRASAGGGGGDWRMKHAQVNSVQCITSRHMFERCLGLVREALGEAEGAGEGETTRAPASCENLAQFTSELAQALGAWAEAGAEAEERRHFVMVFDGVDVQREAPASLVAGLARLSEMIPCLTSVFIVAVPPPAFLRTTAVVHVHFPGYAKHEFVKILAQTAAPRAALADLSAADTLDLWVRFCGTVHDALARAAVRSLPLLRDCCERLWPLFVAPVELGTHDPREFSKLLIAARVHFQDEGLVNPSLVSAAPVATGTAAAATTAALPPKTDLAVLLPTMPRLILLAAYLASHNPARHDVAVFSTFHHGKKKKRGGLSSTLPQQSSGSGRGGGGARAKHRKIARKLLGAHSFVMERMLAILAAVRSEWAAAAGVAAGLGAGVDGDVGVAMATLASLRLLVRVGLGSDLMDRGARWRITVGWDDVRAIGRSVGLEIEDWLVE